MLPPRRTQFNSFESPVPLAGRVKKGKAELFRQLYSHPRYINATHAESTLSECNSRMQLHCARVRSSRKRAERDRVVHIRGQSSPFVPVEGVEQVHANFEADSFP